MIVRNRLLEDEASSPYLQVQRKHLVAAGAVEQLSEQVHVCVRSRVTHDAK